MWTVNKVKPVTTELAKVFATTGVLRQTHLSMNFVSNGLFVWAEYRDGELRALHYEGQEHKPAKLIRHGHGYALNLPHTILVKEGAFRYSPETVVVLGQINVPRAHRKALFEGLPSLTSTKSVGQHFLRHLSINQKLASMLEFRAIDAYAVRKEELSTINSNTLDLHLWLGAQKFATYNTYNNGIVHTTSAIDLVKGLSSIEHETRIESAKQRNGSFIFGGLHVRPFLATRLTNHSPIILK